MSKGRSGNVARVWLTGFLFIALLTFLMPFWPGASEAAEKTTAFAYSPGGPGGLGYDYLGRPIGAQLLVGGRALLIVSLVCAIVSQTVGMTVGLWMAARPRQRHYARLPLDVLLVLPMSVVALIAYRGIGASLYASIPVTAALSVPFTSRFYLSHAEPLVRSAFFEQALVAGDSMRTALVREVVPVLLRSFLTDLGQTFITAMYLSATVSFLGAGVDSKSFLWSTMIAKNLPGLALNPWAVFAPMAAILLLTLPANLFVDAMKSGSFVRDRQAVRND